jgi:hypothetical protein
MSSPAERANRWGRKLRKLVRNPSAFARDSQVLKQWLQQEVSASSPLAHPRWLVSIATNSGRLKIQRFERKLAGGGMTTVICLPHDEKPELHPLLGSAMGRAEFGEFRDGRLFGLAYTPSAARFDSRNIQTFFRACKDWDRPHLAGVRNAVFLNPTDALPWALRAANADLRIVVYVTRALTDLRWVTEAQAATDVLVVERSVFEQRPLRGIRTLVVDDDADLVAVLRQLIVDHGDKEKNAFIPVYGRPCFLEDMESLLDSHYDGVLGLREFPKCADAGSFHEIGRALAAKTRWLLLREEQFHRYRALCEASDVHALLMQSLADGCRYHLRCVS